jgi:dipeptidyl aminopeptidase/acylaminoacyl peptidase
MVVQGHRRPARLIQVSNSKTRTVAEFGYKGSAALIRQLPAVEPYYWNAPDGLEMQGWLMRGKGRKGAPLVMEVHGGPIWRSSPFFLGRAAHYVMLAERGYSLFWPNPRGSSGRGQDFARAVVGDMGGADMRDLISGVDRIVAQGRVDRRRIGLIGGSYGGFMVSWLVTQDQRFAAAVSVAPITNWLSFHLTTNIGHFVESYLLRCGENVRARDYVTRSPVMFARGVKTPTLNICGALDLCAPPGQAQEFHNALRQHGAKSMLVTYPTEGHNVRSFPGMIDYSARVVDWFVSHMGTSRGAHRAY